MSRYPRTCAYLSTYLGFLTTMACGLDGPAASQHDGVATAGPQSTSPSALTVKRPPPTAPKAQAVVDLASALAQTAHVVEGIVSRVDYEYTEAEGPWTVVTLTSTRSHLGAPVGDVVIRQFGGPTPEGRRVAIADQTRFIEGSRYLVFLRNTAWNYSPVVSDFAFRVDTAAGREVLVNHSGRSVTAISEAGIGVGEQLFERTKPFASGLPAARGTFNATQLAGTLSRQSFVQLLRTHMADRGMMVGGEYFTHPEGKARWRPVTRSSAEGTSRPDKPQPMDTL